MPFQTDGADTNADETVDDNGPEIVCAPNLFGFCRYCGRDMEIKQIHTNDGTEVS